MRTVRSTAKFHAAPANTDHTRPCCLVSDLEGTMLTCLFVGLCAEGRTIAATICRDARKSERQKLSSRPLRTKRNATSLRRARTGITVGGTRHSGDCCRRGKRYLMKGRKKQESAKRHVSDLRPRPRPGLARRQVYGRGRPHLPDRDTGAGAPATDAASGGSRGWPEYRGIHLRLSRLAARRLRP